MNLVHDRTVSFEEESIADLVKDLRDETINMVHQQIELAKTETSEKVSQLSSNASSIATGGAVLYAGFLFLLTAFTFLGYMVLNAWGLSPVISMWVMPLITGVIVSIVGWVMISGSLNKLKRLSIIPEKTAHSIKEDQKWIKRKM
ncbi:MAG TPA: phage holin family protein [Chitinispirillaceae bacterium]|nr:phage holin family protein [Chitinispirillaceae bacterium]